ncbi:MAG: hypothetical protein RL322_2411 [Pseudomonadota bacterium]|jgi:L-alanine-DL-glutamate epimerase-like enolase superfamily enzyme
MLAPTESSAIRGMASIEVVPLHVPLERPFHAAVGVIASVDPILVIARDQDGCTGYGLAFAFGPRDAQAIVAAICAISPAATGAGSVGIRASRRALLQALEFIGVGGPSIAALSAIDMALWDHLGRRSQTPLWQLLGGARPSVAAYASCGSLALDDHDLVAEVEELIDHGHRAVKIKCRGDAAFDRKRMLALRAAFGERLRIAADLNQALSVKEAIRWTESIESCSPWWIEEPIAARDLDGHARVRSAITCDLASGENLYGEAAALESIQRRSADILMPNLQRIGGITSWLSIASHAEAAGIRMGAHVHPEYQIQMMCATDSAVAVECWPGWPWLWQEPLVCIDGEVRAPARPGIGLSPDWDTIERYRMDR